MKQSKNEQKKNFKMMRKLSQNKAKKKQTRHSPSFGSTHPGRMQEKKCKTNETRNDTKQLMQNKVKKRTKLCQLMERRKQKPSSK